MEGKYKTLDKKTLGLCKIEVWYEKCCGFVNIWGNTLCKTLET